jgi:cytochrome P450
MTATASAAAPEIYFNPWDPTFRANPYPHYRPLLEGPPRIIQLFAPVAIISRYADVVAVLQDHARFSSARPPVGEIRNEGPFRGTPTMLTSDPPVHTRLRRLISRDFTPKRIRELEPRIRQIASELLDAVARKGSFEAMADLANVLPVMVIAEMLGVPPREYETFKHWSDAVVAGANTLPGEPLPQTFRNAADALREYFAGEIDKRRRAPGPDLISALVAAHEETESLSAEELLAFVILLLLAGNETTTNLIGNGLLALGRHPGQMKLLRDRPELIQKAIEEILRYDGPVQTTFRFAKESANVGGIEISAGTGCFVVLAAADRDPTQFKDPERFDITRDPNEHVAFGDGIHFCIGAPLARLEGSIAIASSLQRFPRLRLAGPDAPLAYKGSFALRGLAALPMAID